MKAQDKVYEALYRKLCKSRYSKEQPIASSKYYRAATTGGNTIATPSGSRYNQRR